MWLQMQQMLQQQHNVNNAETGLNGDSNLATAEATS